MLRWVLAAGLLLAVPAAASAQDAAAGEKVFKKKCAACHAVGPGAKTKVGPELNGIVGRKAGSVEGFKYSKGMTDSGITWDDATLHEWVTNPKKMVPGTKMILPGGVKDELDRDDLVAYLAQFNADGSTK